MFPYFEILVSIHESIFKEYNFGLRPLFTQMLEINQAIEELYTKEYKTLDELVDDILHCSAITLLYQPFWDGNHRTILAFIKHFLCSKEHCFNIDRIQEDFLTNTNMIPIIYNSSEKIPDNCRKNFIKALKITKKT